MEPRFKTVASLLVAAGVVLCLAAVSWSIPVTNVFNRHNMSSGADDSHPHAKTPALGGTDRICVFCHTPHSATPESTLWSRPDPATLTFDLYAGRLAIKDIPAKSQYNSLTVTYPNGASRMCMSCHDGATAIGAVIGQPAEIEMNQRFITGSALVDLSKSHPISFVWDNDVATDVNSWHVAEATGSQYVWPPNYNVAPLDRNNRMQCTTRAVTRPAIRWSRRMISRRSGGIRPAVLRVSAAPTVMITSAASATSARRRRFSPRRGRCITRQSWSLIRRMSAQVVFCRTRMVSH